MKNHNPALFLIRRRLRELRFAVEDARDDRNYNKNIEENYIEPLLEEIDGLEDSKALLEKALGERTPKIKLPTRAFDLNSRHVGYYLKSENGTEGRILDVKIIEESDGRDNWSTSKVEVELDGDGPFSYPVSVLFVNNIQIELSENVKL